ncbi:Guanine nucleotide-binding protein subunit gamma-1 [Orchesella cincta]|uniref:Guanine nucleotide-binding protein subunit gamma-1 n=1 Tax=Orchesella cincta TaxID=48709 RepID=A0A1D2MKZ2_ORCCI|nr:Guanine nucleotide-binding protein subunit gamma-1 [Orchesella cincta]
MYTYHRERFLYNFNWQFERPVQVLPTLREMFFMSDMREPEYIGFMSTLQQQRLIVEQLRREAAVRRINVSQAVEEIKKFVQDHQREDCLIYGFHPPKSNPFREKNQCQLL